MEIALAAVIITIVLDFGFGYLFVTKPKKKRDREFMDKFDVIMDMEHIPFEDRVRNAKELCRMTVGDTSYGVYMVLSKLPTI
jgi:hypothetical protein